MPYRNSINDAVGIIGTINRDTIVRADGSRIESWGGILYNIKYLAENSRAAIYPAVNVGADCYRPIIALLGRYHNVDTSYVKKVPQPNNHCHLAYASSSDKSEILTGGVPALTFARIKNLARCRIIIVNFISGRDVTLWALERLRSQYGGIIYMDIHSLTLGRRKAGRGVKRYLRPPRNWRRYVATADILQINRSEFELLSQSTFTPSNAEVFFNDLDSQTGILLITLGHQGTLLLRRGNKGPELISAPKVEKIYDSTGCGDIFTAGFVVSYLKTDDAAEAVKFGNQLASSRCRVKGPIF